MIKFLECGTAKQVISRLNKINRAGIFERVEVDWLDEAKREGIFGQLSRNEQNEYMDTLYQLSRSTHVTDSVKQHAEEVYQTVQKAVIRQDQMIGQVK